MTALRAVLVCVLFAVAFPTAAPADTFTQRGDNYWAVLASRQELDQAIGAAQAFGGPDTKVLHATNGWYAAVAGPYRVAGGRERAFLDDLITNRSAPKDSFLSKGASFDQLAWSPPKDNVLASLAYDGAHDATLERGDLRLSLSRRRAGDDGFVPVLTVFAGNKRVVETELGTDNPTEKPAALARLVTLDPGSMPEIVFTYYWQGAHCCTVTTIVTQRRDGNWVALRSDAMNGDGYGFEDIEGRGFSYLISIDESFLYAFASYAGSFAPIRIQQLEVGALVDTTRESKLRHRVLQDVYRQEALAKQQSDIEENGYLAGWVANKVLVGDGEEAWRFMLANYDHDANGFGIDSCSIDLPISKCPDDKKAKLPFPAGLRQFLFDHGYIWGLNLYPLPNE